MSWGRNNLAPHALLSVLCDPLSPFSAGLNLGRHLGPFGGVPPDRWQQAEYISKMGAQLYTDRALTCWENI